MSYMLHETLEVHEIAAFKTVGLLKAKTMRGLLSDEKLKDILKQDVELSSRHLNELGELLKKTIQ